MDHQLAAQDAQDAQDPQGRRLTPRRAYPTDFSDREWATLEPLVPRAIAYPNLQQPIHSRREIMNAIRYRTRTGCAWRLLPHDFPPWKTVYNTYRNWAKTGAVKAIHDSLAE